MPGDQPFDFRNSAIQSTSGVFPLPPTVRLPTTITGTPGCFELRSLSLKSKRRMRTAAPNNRLIGHSSQATAPRRYQCLTTWRTAW